MRGYVTQGRRLESQVESFKVQKVSAVQVVPGGESHEAPRPLGVTVSLFLSLDQQNDKLDPS